MNTEKPTPELQAASVEPRAERHWIVVVTGPGAMHDPWPVAEGGSVLGSGALADLVLADAAVKPQHLRLVPGNGELLVEVLAEGGTDVLCGHGLLHLPARATITLRDQGDMTWQLGAFSLTIRPDEPQPAAVRPPEPVVAPRRSAALMAPFMACGLLFLSGLVLVLSHDAGAAAEQPALVLPRSEPGAATAEVERALTESALGGLLRVDASKPGLAPEVSGILVDPQNCDRMAELRRQLGANRFTDRVVCLPALQQSASEYLRESGVKVLLRGQGLTLEGVVDTPAARSRLATALASLEGLVEVDRSGLVEADDKPRLDAVERKARARIAAAQVGDPGHVVTPTGEFVYVGGWLLPGVELVAVVEAGVRLRASGQLFDLAL